ncbi:MAG: DUF1156 domain-containing protein [Clostridiales bacterium]|jgi:adenine-specific DNA methylase|nr:DUF1156 domain-containing protein [Clostridiales bacterium]
MISFIEKQFPVSKLSKESFKERNAKNGQTITGLGKWWGRKPLVLVRAAILGCLMPTSDNPQRDMDVFLKIMSMDAQGLWLRHMDKINKSDRYWQLKGNELKNDFEVLSYDEKLKACVRPEQFTRPSNDQVWDDINLHLGTQANNLQDLMRQLSEKRYGKGAVIGDCFCGGGSVPFEAARMGLDVYASDLNPVAALLTWATLNICGASEDELKEIEKFRKEIYDKVDKEITDLGIEHDDNGDRAYMYLYCVQVRCPECGTLVPMSPSWVIGKGTKTVAQLIENGDKYDIAIKMNASDDEIKTAEIGTATDKGLRCPHCGRTTPISALRHDRVDENGNVIYGLRMWEKTDFEPRSDDILQERLYCIKYEKPSLNQKKAERYYRAPNARDLQNEEKVREIVAENIEHWQRNGYIPSTAIEPGEKTMEVIRNRGWSYWHHLFNARQLLLISSLSKAIEKTQELKLRVTGMLGLNKCADWNSRLCRWHSSAANEKTEQTFYNQALNTLYNWGTRSLIGAETSWLYDINKYPTNKAVTCKTCDARTIAEQSALWITDPPYADAVVYHELSELFLSWDKRQIKEAFPDWYADSKRVLAVRGDGNFAQGMIEIYTNLTNHMPDDGMQVVMFTHSDSAVWAQLALIMWKAGLKVTAAWNIATETEAGGLKEGNFVKGTVLLVLRKRTGTDEAFLDEINAEIKREVVSQIESMRELDEKEEPNFADPDFVLAAYAASLKVLTSYSSIGEIDLDYELELAIAKSPLSKIVELIERAKKQAYDCIIPIGFDGFLWRDLFPSERFYIKGLEAEKKGDYQVSTYQEYARGFALTSYKSLLAKAKANECRLKTPSEFAMRTTNDVPGFENSTLRLVLASIYVSIKEDEQPAKGLSHLKNNLVDYWGKRDLLKQLLTFLKDTKNITNMPHWSQAAAMAEHIYVLLDNDNI